MEPRSPLSLDAGDHPAVAEQFAEFATSLRADEVPDDVLDRIQLHILDTLGCGLAAVGNAAAPYAHRLGDEAKSDVATVVGLTKKVEPQIAALINGILFHALDYDDTHAAAMAHVSSVVVPAAMAGAERAGCSGEDFLLAVAAGCEVSCRIGCVAGDAFHLRGFHPTAICGVFGATAAVARLRSLSEQQAVHAMGVAGSMSAGLMAYLSDGSETKRVHPGWMAHAAHVAVDLARHGASGPRAVIEGRNGIFEAYLGRSGVPPEDFATALRTHWETRALAIKPYPACHFIHAPLDALRDLAATYQIRPDTVVGLTVMTPLAGAELVAAPLERKQHPTTPYESKFSAPYALAAWLVTGSVDAATFDDPWLSDPRILELASRVDYEVRDYESFPASLPGGVRVRLVSGEELEHHVEHQRGDPLNPMSTADILEKYRRNATQALAGDVVGDLERSVLGLRAQPTLDFLTELGEAAPR